MIHATSTLAVLTMPKSFPAQLDLLEWCQTMGPAMAVLLLAAGIVYLLFGVHLYKGLVTLNAAMLGGYFGAIAGNPSNLPLLGALIGAVIGAALAYATMKYAVAVMGGVYGAILGAALWRTCGLEPSFAWAGAMTGLVGFGMLSFILFRGSLMMFTSLQGGVMLVLGILGLIYHYPDLAGKVTRNLTATPILLPVLILIPTLVGVIYQQMNYGSADGSGVKEGGSGSGEKKK